MGYRTQRELAYDCTWSKGDKIRKRLRWEPGILNGDGDKPKGMHWRTFARLLAAQFLDLTLQCLDSIALFAGDAITQSSVDLLLAHPFV